MEILRAVSASLGRVGPSEQGFTLGSRFLQGQSPRYCVLLPFKSDLGQTLFSAYAIFTFCYKYPGCVDKLG